MRHALLRGILVAALTVTIVAALPAQIVRGVVTERVTGKPIRDGRVLLLTEPRLAIAQGTTNDSGRFLVVAPGPGTYRLEFERPGYRLLITPPFQLRSGESTDYALQVSPLPPIALDTAVVEGKVVPRYLAGFYQRRAQGVGAFLTREEFERWYPQVTTDIVRHAQVFDIIANPDKGRNGDFRTLKIQSRRGVPDGFGPNRGECPPLIFLDGSMVGNARDVDVDDLLGVGAIAAMEFYEGGSQVPAQFQANGSSCGVMAVWSRMEGNEVAEGPHRIDLGGQLGGQLTSGGFAYGRVGVQASVGLVGPIEFYPSVNVFVQSWSGFATQRSGWQVVLGLRGRPLGHASAWYVGGGMTMLDTQDRATTNSLFQPEQSEEHALLMTGVTLPIPFIRPLIEAQLVNPLHPHDAELNLYTGFALRVR